MEATPAPVPVTLVSLRAHEDEYAVPLGAACVASAIKAHPGLSGRVRVEVLDLDPAADSRAIADLLAPTWRAASTGRAAIGFSLYSWNRLKLQRVAADLRARHPELLMFAGGPEAAALVSRSDPACCAPESTFDAIFIGEAEATVPEWLAGWLSAISEVEVEAPDAMAPSEIPLDMMAPRKTIPWMLGPAQQSPVHADVPEAVRADVQPHVQGFVPPLVQGSVQADVPPDVQPVVRPAPAIEGGSPSPAPAPASAPEPVSAPSPAPSPAQARREIRCRVPDAAALPSPWLDGTLDPASCDSLTWEIVRGCPFSCAYCYEGRGSRAVRRLPRARIETELARFAAISPRRVFVLDPTFNLDRERTLALLDLIAQRAPHHEWHFEARAELLDRAQARAFARLGANLQIGLQSAHPAVLARVNRDIDPEAFARKLALLDEAGVAFGLDLIYGLPGDTLAGFRASVDYALSRAPNHLDVFPLSVLPGTELADRAAALSLRHMPEPPYAVLGQPGFEAEDMRAAASLARACDVFYSRGRAVPWFGALARALRLRPSALLEAFDGFCRPAAGPGDCGGAASFPQRAIEDLQVAFARSALIDGSRIALGDYGAAAADAAEDLIRFNGALSRALAERESTVLELYYSLDEVAGAGILDLARFARRAARYPDRVSVEPSPDGPRVRRIAASRRNR